MLVLVIFATPSRDMYHMHACRVTQIAGEFDDAVLGASVSVAVQLWLLAISNCVSLLPRCSHVLICHQTESFPSVVAVAMTDVGNRASGFP